MPSFFDNPESLALELSSKGLKVTRNGVSKTVAFEIRGEYEVAFFVAGDFFPVKLDLEITELKGRGVIQTFTVNFVAPLGRESEAPYTVVMVELDEGPWIMGNLVDVDPAVVNMDIIGRRVKMGETIGARVFPGDAYSAGDAARPLFQFE